VIARTVFQGTYVQRAPPGPFQDWLNYNASLPQSWRFPYIDGHLRAYDLDKISTTKQDFRSNALWDAGANMPLPTQRRVFTALKGKGNAGWAKLDVRHTETDPGTCVPSGRNDANGRPICALSWEMGACGSAGVTQAALDAGDPGGAHAKKLGMFVQQVRGHCSAHNKFTGEPVYEPIDAQCDDLKQQKNRAKLGGVDHSSPAVVGPSRYIGNDAKSGIKWALRPVVSYVGGRDGMLHAIYVSGADPSWSAEGVSLPAGLTPGTELWSFLPSGQLCGLATNSAMVDAVVNVVDVFGNFPRDANNDGVFDLSSAAERPNGIRRWRTILIAAAGQGGSEVFALDVTNPLKPILLWDIAGAKDTDDTLDASDPATYAWRYANPPGGISAKNTDDQPRQKAALYDYRNLGLTYGSSVGMLWRGNAYRYVVYLATSTADFGPGVETPLGFKGVEVFAADVITGQKVWHWQNRYTRARDAAGTEIIADNTIPGRPALVDVDQNGTADRLYVGDMEGHLWELDAATGRNANFLHDEGSGQFHALPFFGTPPMSGGTADSGLKDLFKPFGSASLAQQPLTSPIGIGRLTNVPCSVYKYLEGRIDVAQGSMGVDWAIAPFESGNVFVLPSAPESTTVRLKDASCTKLTGDVLAVDTRERTINLSSKPSLKTRGVLLPEAVWEIPLGIGERMFGMPKLVGNDILIDTSAGSFSGDITETAMEAGTTKLINAANPTGKVVASIGKAFGGVLVIDQQVIATSATGMIRVADAVKAPEGAAATATTARSRFTPATFGSWEERPSEPRQ
jgi:type IV pilus assembly protein PilY1